MKILLLGSGGREHALAWKLRQSALCSRLYIAPGNAGTLESGENVAISLSDFFSIKTFCISNDVDMVIVGPEDPLVKGIYDYLTTSKDDLTWGGMVIGP
jgi:phosphoribosylamine--glycine ligase